MLAEQTTPLHIICESPEDHHELLDLMINLSQRTIIDTQDMYACTALLYAVRNANVNCVKCLIANSADVNIGCDTYTRKTRFLDETKTLNPIMETIRMMSFQFGHSSTVIMSDIFDLLCEAAVEKNKDHFRRYTAYILCAVAFRNVHSAKKLIKIGAPLDITDHENYYVWELVSRMGNVELLKYMFNRGIDKNITSKNGSILWHVVISGNIEAVRYLLDLRVAIPTYTPKVCKKQCDQCKIENILIMQYYNERDDRDPCRRAIKLVMVEIVKLLDEYGSQTCKSFSALRCAVQWGSGDVLTYLLSRYTYPLNVEYCIKEGDTNIFTLLTDPTTRFTAQIIKLLLDHGADPAKEMCSATSANAIMAATIANRPLEVIAQYIRSGVDINLRSSTNKYKNVKPFKSWANKYENVSPFELSVLLNRPYISAMLLISGCSRGVFNNRKRKFKGELEKLIKEWNMHDNNVTPLQQRCRCVILNHLSPQADLKIKKLPLPPRLIKFLNIPELDNIVYKYSKADRY